MENLQADDITAYTAVNRTSSCAMLDHLLDYDPEIEETESASLHGLATATPVALLEAQDNTAQWLASMGAPTAEEAENTAASMQAQKAFTNLSASVSVDAQRKALLQMNSPPAVRKLVGMLTAYDWAFVEQARELRGYAVSKILEETDNPDARIRLRALELLGKVTEVALFTDRVEVKRTNLDDRELEAKINDKLARFMQITDVEPTEIVDVTPSTDADA